MTPVQMLHDCILRLPDGTLTYCGSSEAQQLALQHCIEGKPSESDLATLEAVPVLDVDQTQSPDQWAFAFAHSHGKITTASMLGRR